MPDPPPVVNLAEAAARLDQPWTPRVVAQLNETLFKVAWVQGEFPWHHHIDTDEAFWILEGEVELDFEDAVKRGLVVVEKTSAGPAMKRLRP